jgi:3-oxoacyl-[acyl-carrier protein] reductase
MYVKTLQNKLALITGASRGIGAAIALRLAKDGADVVLHYWQGEAEAKALASQITALGQKAWTLQADLASHEGPRQLLSGLDALKLPKLDVLVNNAGVASFADFAGTDEATYDTQANVNMRSAFFVAQGAVARMNDGGRVINLSSLVTRTYFPGIPAYAATKGFIDVLTLHMAAALGARGITVNAVAPGPIDTRMSAWIRTPEGEATLKQIQVLAGKGQPEHIAGVVAFLAGPDGAWTTGQVIDASGGTKL